VTNGQTDTYRRTDRLRYSVCSSNRLLMQCMRCGLIIIKENNIDCTLTLKFLQEPSHRVGHGSGRGPISKIANLAGRVGSCCFKSFNLFAARSYFCDKVAGKQDTAVVSSSRCNKLIRGRCTITAIIVVCAFIGL